MQAIYKYMQTSHVTRAQVHTTQCWSTWTVEYDDWQQSMSFKHLSLSAVTC